MHLTRLMPWKIVFLLAAVETCFGQTFTANLTGIVNGNPKARVPLFNLDLSHAKLAAGKHIVTARGIGLKLTSVAAKALNGALGTKLFSAGLKLGTAGTLLRF